MPLHIVRNDITRMTTDAIVNATDSKLSGSGGVDAAIHAAAGPELSEACMKLGSCAVGEAKITDGFKLPAKHIIHTVGPRWHGGFCGEQKLLRSCYKSSLTLAESCGCESVAFPLIAAGTFGYPKELVLRAATEAISEFLQSSDMDVFLVVYGQGSYQISKKLFKDVDAYIDDNYTGLRSCSSNIFPSPRQGRRSLQDLDDSSDDIFDLDDAEDESVALPYAVFEAADLDDPFGQLDESFSEMLLRKITESGMTDAQCYRKANIDRRLFSKIRSDKSYQPSKPTVIAFALALELPLPEMKDMLMKAGFALSRSSKFDVIIEYFVRHGNYNVYEINEVLFEYDQSLIGA